MKPDYFVRTSFAPEDVTVLLKDLTGKMTPMGEKEREIQIQKGVHYSELLPKEYEPSQQYLDLYSEALDIHSEITARAAMDLGELIWNHKKGTPVLVSLARAGTPLGVVVKKFLERKYKTYVPHYSISIIRDRGIDQNALEYILRRHSPEDIQFLDGWVGKGTIAKELIKYVAEYPEVDSQLAVLADPTGITALRGTSEDFLIPSSCLNAPVSGLFSRTVLNNELIGLEDFHGAVYYEAFEKADRTYEFINRIDDEMKRLSEGSEAGQYVITNQSNQGTEGLGIAHNMPAAEEIQRIANDFQVSDINFIKPGIGETTRVLMRRVPEIVLIKDLSDFRYNSHILRLCQEKNVMVKEYPLENYRVCGIIKKMADV